MIISGASIPTISSLYEVLAFKSFNIGEITLFSVILQAGVCIVLAEGVPITTGVIIHFILSTINFPKSGGKFTNS